MSSGTNLVSCIIPVFNGERYLAEALESVLAQTYKPIEAIVVDDGSTDGTRDIVIRYGRRVRYFWQANAGPAAAFNKGVQKATGDFLAFLAADDLWHPEKLERQMECFGSQPEAGACITYLKNFWVREVAEEEKRLEGHRLAQPMPGYTSVTLLVRREVMDRVGYFDARLQHGNDLDWFMRASEAGVKLELLSDVLVFRRLHPGNRSRQLASDSHQTFLRVLKASLDRRRHNDLARPAAYQFPARPPRKREG